MTHERERKRSAIEPPAVLVSTEQPANPNAKRPMTTTLGALFVLGRGLAGLLWIGAFALLWKEVLPELDLDPDAEPYVFWAVVGFGTAGSLLLLLLARAIHRGSNIARVLVMTGLTFSIVTAAIGYFSTGEEITIRTTLITVSLDILVLLALSSQASRTWARQPRKSRDLSARRQTAETRSAEPSR